MFRRCTAFRKLVLNRFELRKWCWQGIWLTRLIADKNVGQFVSFLRASKPSAPRLTGTTGDTPGNMNMNINQDKCVVFYRNFFASLSSISISYEKRISQRAASRINSSIAAATFTVICPVATAGATHAPILHLATVATLWRPVCLPSSLPACLPHWQPKWPIKRWQAAAVNCRTRLVLVSQCMRQGGGGMLGTQHAWSYPSCDPRLRRSLWAFSILNFTFFDVWRCNWYANCRRHVSPTLPLPTFSPHPFPSSLRCIWQHLSAIFHTHWQCQQKQTFGLP